MRWWGPKNAVCVLLVAAAALVALPSAAAATPNPFFGVVGVNYPTQAELDHAAQGGVGVFRF